MFLPHQSGDQPKPADRLYKSWEDGASAETGDRQQEHDAFKASVIRDILNQVDYQSALRRGVVEVSMEDMSKELESLSTRALIAWYEAFLFIRSELMFAGYELNGLKILDRPIDTIRKLMESDANFDIRQYIF